MEDAAEAEHILLFANKLNLPLLSEQCELFIKDNKLAYRQLRFEHLGSIYALIFTNFVEKNHLGNQLETLLNDPKTSDFELEVEAEDGETGIFRLHKSVLVSRSPFFDCLLRGNFKEKSHNSLRHTTHLPLSSFKVLLK